MVVEHTWKNLCEEYDNSSVSMEAYVNQLCLLPKAQPNHEADVDQLINTIMGAGIALTSLQWLQQLLDIRHTL